MRSQVSGPDVDAALRSLGTDEQVQVDNGLWYRDGEPVRVRVARRGHRFDISDDGSAVALAGAPSGWQALTEAVVAAEGFNVNRRGVVFVPAVEGRDIAGLAARLAETSRAVYLELLDVGA